MVPLHHQGTLSHEECESILERPNRLAADANIITMVERGRLNIAEYLLSAVADSLVAAVQTHRPDLRAAIAARAAGDALRQPTR